MCTYPTGSSTPVRRGRRGVIAVGCVAVSVRKASDDLDDRQVPLAGLVAAFIFAVQMLNFPVASGTSGHLLGRGAGGGARRALGRCAVRRPSC